MRTDVLPLLLLRSTSIEQRRLRFLGLSGLHAPQMLPMRGTPPDEPVPSKVNTVSVFILNSINDHGLDGGKSYPVKTTCFELACFAPSVSCSECNGIRLNL